MTILYFLIPLSLGMAASGVAAFLWANSQGQFDDRMGPAEAMLNDDSSIDKQI